MPIPPVADANAALALQDQAFGIGVGFNVKVLAAAGGLQVAGRGAHAPPAGNAGLAHGDAVLAAAVIVGIIGNADLRRRLDDNGEQRVGWLRV